MTGRKIEAFLRNSVIWYAYETFRGQEEQVVAMGASSRDAIGNTSLLKWQETKKLLYYNSHIIYKLYTTLRMQREIELIDLLWKSFTSEDLLLEF